MKFFFCTLLIFLFVSPDSKAGDSLILITHAVKEIKTKSECYLIYKIVSKAKNKIQIEKHPFMTEWDDEYARVWMLLEKKDGDGFTKATYAFPPPPPVFPGEEYLAFLSTNDTLPVRINLCHNYEGLKKGEYRIKILLRASIDNDVNDITSDWFYFRIKEDLN